MPPAARMAGALPSTLTLARVRPVASEKGRPTALLLAVSTMLAPAGSVMASEGIVMPLVSSSALAMVYRKVRAVVPEPLT